MLHISPSLSFPSIILAINHEYHWKATCTSILKLSGIIHNTNMSRSDVYQTVPLRAPLTSNLLNPGLSGPSQPCLLPYTRYHQHAPTITRENKYSFYNLNNLDADTIFREIKISLTCWLLPKIVLRRYSNFFLIILSKLRGAKWAKNLFLFFMIKWICDVFSLFWIFLKKFLPKLKLNFYDLMKLFYFIRKGAIIIKLQENSEITENLVFVS